MRRLRKVIYLFVSVLVFLPVFVYPDGMFFGPRPDFYGPKRARPADITQPLQKALVYYRDGREDLVLEVAYKGEVSQFAWVIPVPARPKVKKAGGAPFHELSRLTAPRYKGPIEMMKGKMPGMPGKAPPVVVLERKKVGIYDVSVLKATDPMALINWLNKNKYAFPKKGKSVVDYYVKKKWVFVAMRIFRSSEEIKKGLKEGIIQPIRLTFKSREIVYPMKITSLNPEETEILLYVAAPYRVKGEGFEEEQNQKVTLTELATGDYPTLRNLIRRESILCKLRAIFSPDEITKDLVLQRRWL